MKLAVDNNFQLKYMVQRFEEPTVLATAADVQAWRQAWLGALGSWHSPYKLAIDCSQLTVNDDEAVRKALDVMLRFFNGFHLRKVVGYGRDEARGHASLPFPVVATEDEAFADIGVRQLKTRDPTDFRSTIHLQNHFPTHVIELSFGEPVRIETKEQVLVLKSKLTNNLMQWHSKWSLLVDCTNLDIDPAVDKDLDSLFKTLRGFFMKTVIGYSPRTKEATYPFDVYRARHRAAAILEGEGNFSGDKADCQSRRKLPST